MARSGQAPAEVHRSPRSGVAQLMGTAAITPPAMRPGCREAGLGAAACRRRSRRRSAAQWGARRVATGCVHRCGTVPGYRVWAVVADDGARASPDALFWRPRRPRPQAVIDHYSRRPTQGNGRTTAGHSICSSVVVGCLPEAQLPGYSLWRAGYEQPQSLPPLPPLRMTGSSDGADRQRDGVRPLAHCSTARVR